MKKYQGGSTLIIVMGLLVVITLIGTLAIKNSLVSLNIATNNQAEQIMLQTADATAFIIEDPTKINLYNAKNNIFGYLKEDVAEKELIFCIRGQDTRFFNISQASVMYWEDDKNKPSNNLLTQKGYCVVDGNSYVSGRKVGITQVSIRYTASDQEAKAFSYMVKGSDSKTAKLEDSKRMLVHMTSLVPSLASGVKAKDINSCLSNHLSYPLKPAKVTVPSADAKKSVSDCLKELNVPHNVYVVEYKLSQDINKI